MVCPHGDRCALEIGHDDGCNHRTCGCNEPDEDIRATCTWCDGDGFQRAGPDVQECRCGGSGKERDEGQRVPVFGVSTVPTLEAVFLWRRIGLRPDVTGWTTLLETPLDLDDYATGGRLLSLLPQQGLRVSQTSAHLDGRPNPWWLPPWEVSALVRSPVVDGAWVRVYGEGLSFARAVAMACLRLWAVEAGAGAPVPPVSACSCYTCLPPEERERRMVVCQACGNKRCPHATDHRHVCTRSNEPGQRGSRFGLTAPQRARALGLTEDEDGWYRDPPELVRLGLATEQVVWRSHVDRPHPGPQFGPRAMAWRVRGMGLAPGTGFQSSDDALEALFELRNVRLS